MAEVKDYGIKRLHHFTKLPIKTGTKMSVIIEPYKDGAIRRLRKIDELDEHNQHVQVAVIAENITARDLEWHTVSGTDALFITNKV